MTIGAMLRVKNEGRWIAEVLRSLEGLASYTLVFDDHSKDQTAAIAEHAKLTAVVESPFNGDVDEARDKDIALDLLFAHHRLLYGDLPHWVLCIDGDEVLEPGSADVVRSAAASGASDCYSLQVVYLWDRPDQIRTDGIYRTFRRQSLWRVAASTNRIARTERQLPLLERPGGHARPRAALRRAAEALRLHGAGGPAPQIPLVQSNRSG
jgi:glycosyltransferase involved in cell wall biosynthesis